MDSCSLVSRRQPETHPLVSRAEVSLCFCLSLCPPPHRLTCGSTWQHFSSSLSLCFLECAYFGLFNKEKTPLPQSILKSNFQNKRLEGVTARNVSR